ncbi:hypothetical protein CPB84DRAFT_1321330 [Gymnopilus junonius]|uniref:Uncharacterized protein n=1 Tax=Gymnopilus junonius TaxID=109634 RepID=A0A9P5TLH3_GYMJU|nr:hypothetical protein CPB84DRAFT_1321330 [Gymnopilus junonius]
MYNFETLHPMQARSSPTISLDYHHLSHLQSIYIRIESDFHKAGENLVNVPDMAVALLGNPIPPNISNVEMEFDMCPDDLREYSLDQIFNPFSILALHLQRSEFTEHVQITICALFKGTCQRQYDVNKEHILERFNRVFDPVGQRPTWTCGAL